MGIKWQHDPEKWAKFLKIKELRAKGEMTNQEIADSVGVHIATVAGWLAGKYTPTPPNGKSTAVAKQKPITLNQVIDEAPEAVITTRRSGRMMFLAYGPEDTLTLCLERLMSAGVIRQENNNESK